MSSVAEILESQMQKWASASQSDLLQLKKRWSTLVGEAIAKNSTPLYIKNQSLLVNVLDATWRCELNLLKTELLKKIKAQCELKTEILDMKFVLRTYE